MRTGSEGRPQQGISFLLIDMKTPGISVRPIITIEGEHEINDIFFENVRVPIANLVGEEDQGWTYAKFLLNHERAKTGHWKLQTRARAAEADRGRAAGERSPPARGCTLP